MPAGNMARLATCISFSLALAACATRPVCEPVRIPVEVEVIRNVVQPVPAELLRQHPVETGPLSRCPQIAAARGDELRACNRDKALIREQGQ